MERKPSSFEVGRRRARGQERDDDSQRDAVFLPYKHLDTDAARRMNTLGQGSAAWTLEEARLHRVYADLRPGLLALLKAHLIDTIAENRMMGRTRKIKPLPRDWLRWERDCEGLRAETTSR